MRKYIFKRFILFVPTILFATILLFALLRFIPGSVIDLMMSDLSGKSTVGVEVNEKYLRESLGLDVSIPEQYGRWLGVWPQKSGAFSGVLQGSLGTSLWTGESVTSIVIQRLPVTLELGLFSIILAWLIALPIGITSAVRQDTLLDYGTRSWAIVWVAVPSFWLATIIVVYPSIWWGWSPSVKYIPFSANPGGNLMQFLLPALIMGAGMSGSIARYIRTLMLDILKQNYIRTAWAKGLPERTVIFRHALRNAIIPLITIIGGELPQLIGGAIIMEQIFCLPGMGRVMLDALIARDYPIISGINMCLITAVLLINLFIDLFYGYLDPRIRYN